MPLQNRINPYGEICFSEHRGAFTGNRGVIHNEHKQIVKNFAVKRWIICTLKYKNFHREVMTPNRWTELFFLDEATALAAGHRPCTFCQYARSVEFRRRWLAANRAVFGISDIKVDAIDKILHTERLSPKKPFVAIKDLPDGAFVEIDKKPFLLREKMLYEWTFGGYNTPVETPPETIVKLLTPPSTVRAFENGFVPDIAF